MRATRLFPFLVLVVIWAVAASAPPIPGWMAQAADAGSARIAQSSVGESRVQASSGKPAARAAAQPGAVSIHVLLLSDIPRNPEEYVEVNGARYIYFNSPRLVFRARPLGEPKPRYPKGKFAQRDGAVILQLLIDERGALHQADVVCAAPPFEKSALESVRGLKFNPAVAKEGPVKSYMFVEFGYGRGYPCGRIPD